MERKKEGERRKEREFVDFQQQQQVHVTWWVFFSIVLDCGCVNVSKQAWEREREGGETEICLGYIASLPRRKEKKKGKMIMTTEEELDAVTCKRNSFLSTWQVDTSDRGPGKWSKQGEQSTARTLSSMRNTYSTQRSKTISKSHELFSLSPDHIKYSIKINRKTTGMRCRCEAGTMIHHQSNRMSFFFLHRVFSSPEILHSQSEEDWNFSSSSKNRFVDVTSDQVYRFRSVKSEIGSCSEVWSSRSKISLFISLSSVLSFWAGHLLDRFTSIAYFEPNQLRKKQLGNGKERNDQRLSLGEDLLAEISKMIILPWHPRVFGFHRYQISTKNTPTFNQTDAPPERGILSACDGMMIVSQIIILLAHIVQCYPKPVID